MTFDTDYEDSSDYYDDTADLQTAEPRMDDGGIELLPTPEKYMQRPGGGRPFMHRRRPYRRRRPGMGGQNGLPNGGGRYNYNFRRRGLRLPGTGLKGVAPNIPPPPLHFPPNSIGHNQLQTQGYTGLKKSKPTQPKLATRRPVPAAVSDSISGESVKTASHPSFAATAIPSKPPTKSQCDYYTDDLCLEVDSYPISEIMSQIGANRRASSDLIADVIDQSADDLIDGVSSNQESTYTLAHYYGNQPQPQLAGQRRQDTDTRDFATDGGFLCPSEIKYAKPKRGKTAQGEWKDIVNVNDYTQTLRMEKCLQPGGSCSYVSHHYKSQCSQVYNYHRLLSWNKARGLHMDIYKVPTCCSCHIMGYSYVYPPLGQGKKGKQDHGNFPTSPAQPAAPRPSIAKPQFSSNKFPQKPQVPAQPSNLPVVNSLDNFISDFNPQAELEQFMQAISDDLKDFNTFGSSRPPRRQSQSSGQFVRREGISASPPSALTTQPSLAAANNNRVPNRFSTAASVSQPPKAVNLGNGGNNSPKRPTPTPYQPVINANNGGGSQFAAGPNYQTKTPFRYRRKKEQTVSSSTQVIPPQNGGRYSSIRRGDGFNANGVPQTTPNSQQESSNPLNKYESIKLDTAKSSNNANKAELETIDNDSNDKSDEVVNYGYHPIIDFFNT